MVEMLRRGKEFLKNKIKMNISKKALLFLMMQRPTSTKARTRLKESSKKGERNKII